MEKTSKFPMRAVYIYLSLPFFIFTIGWAKPYIAAAVSAIVAVCLFFAIKEAPAVWVPSFDRKNTVYLVSALLVIALWVFLSGVGKYVYQNDDHICRNAIFELLVYNDWPVIGENGHAFIYYLAFWLPAALVGKAFGIGAGMFFLYLWSVFGIFLFYLLLCARKKKLSLVFLLVFIFFSGPDIIEMILRGKYPEIALFGHIEWGVGGYQFSSFTTQLFWVFNQAIPAWMATMALFFEKDNRGTVFLISFIFISSSLPFIGILPFAAYFVFTRKYSPIREFRLWARDTFTFRNIAGGGIVGIFSFLYLKSNAVIGNAEMAAINESLFRHLVKYGIFVFFEAVLFIAAIFIFKKRDKLFYLVSVVLLAVPLIKIGANADFCMRASIPALLILCLMFTDSFYEALETGKKKIAVIMAVLFIAGTVTPLHEISRTVKNTAEQIINGEEIGTSWKMEPEQLLEAGSENFFGDPDSSFFFKYIAK